ncbi:hypothetical protein PLICRDRAFT_168043 [Plicaturopsis crispa FD-325 SS-3]|uniref:Xylanolytic transcriptional activator regulatory domain-containing protein n=1 Tax=Plicaturopsis crispa FD-325 SS-3 TaxID=944288 RepID=A0A0C9SR82_PLICR|nr:hypothetical protein PLICRDRAFT_168043 [Plicaturopsis crispa FD-325 SS-3]
MRRNSVSAGPPTNIPVWLPKDRKMSKHIVDVYFTRLNYHRPVFARGDFERTLDGLYDGHPIQHDPGYVCSLYLVFALGTLSELNHRASKMDKDSAGADGPTVIKKLIPHDWPEPDEFFERALSVKPDLRVTISSLQALILLQWYLYTERQGRTLWRLVGSLVRLSIELGLHHDPTMQGNTFTEDECQLRIRLWGIVMVHDRGTSILLGRPLAIHPNDMNTKRPTSVKDAKDPFSKHFELSHPIADIQSDIINSLYTPSIQTPDAVIRHATRISKSMIGLRRDLPESYNWYFGGTEDWPMDKRVKLVQDITEDDGLTLLKIGITRILLLRALFSQTDLPYAQRRRALDDAIVASHNIIVMHNQLIKFPDIAFFVSPIPLHIAAMVILYGHMSTCNRLSRQVAVEDVWMALDMLPRFRWRWERKDVRGGHPLITKLAEQILKVNLRQVGPPRETVLIPEKEWDSDSIMSPSLAAPSVKSQLATPVMAHSAYPGSSPIYGPQPRAASMGGLVPQDGNNNGQGENKEPMIDLPSSLFYPFYPENAANAPGVVAAGVVNGKKGGHPQQREFNNLLAAAAADPDGGYGGQPSQESFMLEEKDSGAGVIHPHHNHNPNVWMNLGEQHARSMQFGMQP